MPTDSSPVTTRRIRRFAAAVGVALAALPVASAWAAWTSGATGAAVVRSQAMPAGPTPQVSVQGRNVTVSWSAATLSGGEPVSAYRVRRVAGNGTAATIGSACSTTQTGLTCTEAAVAPGTWSYGVTPVLGSWTGAEGTRTAVTVGAPTFTLAASAVTTLPGTVSGTIANYVGPATLAFRLDNATTGTLLSSAPAAVPSAGSAQVSLTVPAGVSQGNHTIFAIGEGGDSVAATILVDTIPPTPTGLVTANGTGTVGASDAGDSVSVSFSERLSAASLCAGWADGTTVKTMSSGVVVTIAHDGNPSSNDLLTVTAAPGCGPAGFRFGVVNLGNKGFVRGGSSVTYGATGTPSTVTWNPTTMTLTIVMGTASGSNFGTVPSSTAVYTPDPAIKDLAGLGTTGTASTTGRQL